MENWRRGAKFPFSLGPKNSLGFINPNPERKVGAISEGTLQYPIYIYIYIHIIVIKMSNAVGRAFYPRSGQTKDYEIGICCFSTKYVALRRKSKDWLARNCN